MNQNHFPKYEDIEKSLREKCYVHIPFPADKSLIQEAISAFFKFLEEPDNIKNYIDFTIAPNHRRGDIGFKHRDPDDHMYNDSKDFFHYHPAIFEKHPDFVKENPVVRDFFLKAQPIWILAYKTVSSILKTFNSVYPEAYSKVFDTQNVHLMLRFLKYNWHQSGKYLAKPHYDAGSFTLAIAESCPGLRIGHNPETLKPVEHIEGQAVFMLSSNFKTVLNTNHLSAGWHDVIQTNETLIGTPFARWAIVAFIEAAGVTALPRTETHKWATEKVA